jgi:hypothetical protein
MSRWSCKNGRACRAANACEPTLHKGEDLRSGIARLKRRCRELRADAHRVASAPLPLSHAKERAREIVSSWAQRGAPNVSPLIEHENGEIAWPMRTLQSQIFNAEGQRPIAFAEVPDLVATLSWLFPDAMLKWLDGMLAEEADDASALSIAERQTQSAQIVGDLLSIERDLAALTWRGLDEGLPVWFPQDLSVAAMLAAELVTIPASNGGRTSPEHGAYDIIGGRR